MDTLDDDEWDRTVVMIERLAALGSTARVARWRGGWGGVLEFGVKKGPPPRRLNKPVTKDGRAVLLLTTFRKQREEERTEIARARKAAEDCAKRHP